MSNEHNKHTPGPWVVATSNSWRRIVSSRGGVVCEPITQPDGHPDMHFRNGGEDGPDARLIASAPELLEALVNGLKDIRAHGRVTNDTEELMRAALAKARGTP